MKLEASTPSSDPRYSVLRNKATGLVYRGSDCPRGILAANHWRERANPSLFDSPSTCVCENANEASA